MTNSIDYAFLFALKIHGGQVRKDGKPYIVHPFSVATELAKNGADDDLIRAGLLHDAIEDGGVTEKEIKENFGDEVLRLVTFETEDKSLSWEERKRKTVIELETCDEKCAMLVCADKLSNIRDIKDGLARCGEDVWKNFKRGKDEQEKLYRAYVSVLSRLSDMKMYRDLKQTVEEVFNERSV